MRIWNFFLWLFGDIQNPNYFSFSFTALEDGYDIQKAVINLVARRTVPQVFIHKQHLGGADGKF